METKSRGINQIKNACDEEKSFIHLPQVAHRVGVKLLRSEPMLYMSISNWNIEVVA